MENSRMKEITGNLKRDMRDLVDESAHVVTGFFKRGVCTVRAVADKWRAFTQDISAAVDELMKPPFDRPDSFVKLFDRKTRDSLVAVIKTIRENALRPAS